MSNLPEVIASKYPNTVANFAKHNHAITYNFDLKGRGGSTDYIDFLRVRDLPTTMVCGVDLHKRDFIALRIETEKKERFAVVFFKRYTDGDLWVHTVHDGGLQILESGSSAMSNEKWVLLGRLLETGALYHNDMSITLV